MSHTIEGKPWGGADRERGLAFHFSAADLHRLGNNPQNPKPGDLCIVDRHIGDHFHTYIVCRRRSDGLHAPKFSFAAYEFGHPLFRLTPVDYMRVKQSEIVNLTPYANTPFPDDPNCKGNESLLVEYSRVKSINDDIHTAENQLREVWRKIHPEPESLYNRDGDSVSSTALALQKLADGFKLSHKPIINFHPPSSIYDDAIFEISKPQKGLSDAFLNAGAAAMQSADQMKVFQDMFINSFGIKPEATNTSPSIQLRAYKDLSDPEKRLLADASISQIKFWSTKSQRWFAKQNHEFDPDTIYQID